MFRLDIAFGEILVGEYSFDFLHIMYQHVGLTLESDSIPRYPGKGKLKEISDKTPETIFFPLFSPQTYKLMNN